MNRSYKKYNLIIVLLFLLIVSKVTLSQSLSILFVVNRFPVSSKSIIVNQMVGLIDNTHRAHIYTHKKTNCSVIDKAVKKYDLLDKQTFFISRPHNLDQYDIILMQYGDLAQEFVDIKKAKVLWKLINKRLEKVLQDVIRS